jgi:hypothetical protein
MGPQRGRELTEKLMESRRNFPTNERSSGNAPEGVHPRIPGYLGVVTCTRGDRRVPHLSITGDALNHNNGIPFRICTHLPIVRTDNTNAGTCSLCVSAASPYRPLVKSKSKLS